MLQEEQMARNAVRLSPKDNVASALVALAAGDTAQVGYHDDPLVSVKILDEVPYGFKLAVVDITKGEPILKYGMVMGIASADIKAGQMVHIHNVEGARGRGDK